MMADTPPTPKHRYWRSLLFGMLVFAGTSVLVTPRPSVDPRLIGRWQATTIGIPWPHVHTFEFRNDGVLVEDDGLSGRTSQFWSVANDTIVLRSHARMNAETPMTRLYRWGSQSWSGSAPPTPPDAFRITKLSGETLQLEYVGVRRWPAPTYSLTRLPK